MIHTDTDLIIHKYTLLTFFYKEHTGRILLYVSESDVVINFMTSFRPWVSPWIPVDD